MPQHLTKQNRDLGEIYPDEPTEIVKILTYETGLVAVS